MEHSTSAPNERIWRITPLVKLSFNHPSVVLTADVFQCIRIDVVTDECCITSGGTEIVEVMRGTDRNAMAPGEESLPHRLETFDFVAMFEVQQYPCHLSKTCNELIIGTSIHVRRNKIQVEVFVR